jgi:drug/metabolite transporter (DMT)-like permease
MTFTQLILIVFTVCMLSFGQILFKLAAMEMHSIEVSKFSQFFLLINLKLVIAFVVYGFATVLWVAVLRVVPLSQAYPFIALAFFIVPILSWIWLNEPIQLKNILGASFILLGIYISAQ